MYCLVLQGSVVLSIEPHVFVLSNQFLDSHCSSCVNAASTSPFMRCSGCGTLRYCNTVSFQVLMARQLTYHEQSCQKADWSFHKHECGALQRWAKTAPSAALGIPNDAVRCLGRILWRMKSKGLNSRWVSRFLFMFFVHPITHLHLQSKELQEMQFRGCPALHGCISFVVDPGHTSR